MTSWRWIVILALALAAAPAAATEWAGEWQVEGAAVGRSIERTSWGVRIRLDWPGRGAVRLEGHDGSATLRLEATAPATPGLVGVLTGRDGKKPPRLELVSGAVETSPDGERTRVRFQEDGKT